MTIGEVLGPVPLKRGMEGAMENRWLQVRCGARIVTALDPVGAGRGEMVLLSEGKRAGERYPHIPVDAVIVAVVGETMK